MDPIIKEQIDAISFAIELGKKQIADINSKVVKDTSSLSLSQKKDSLKNDVASLYLSNFWNEYEFLCKKLETEKRDDLHFFVPFLRALSEIYAELLFVINQDEKHQVGIFIGNYLRFLADNYNYFSASKSIKDEYQRFLGEVKDVLDDEKIVFPKIEELSGTKLRKLSFGIPKWKDIFEEKFFEELSKETFDCWQKDKNNSANFYNKYYKIHSNYTHRSFTNSTKSFNEKEIFMIIQFMYIIAQLIFELCDKKLFNESYIKDRNEFHKKIGIAYPKLLVLWAKS